MHHTPTTTQHAEEIATIELVAPSLGWPRQDGGCAAHGQLHVYRVGDRVVATVTQESLRERQALLLHDDLADMLDDCSGFVALGLDRVQTLGAAVAREIVRAANVCADRDGRLVVFGLRDDIARELRRSGALGGVSCVRSKDDALAALSNTQPAERRAFWQRKKHPRAA